MKNLILSFVYQKNKITLNELMNYLKDKISENICKYEMLVADIMLELVCEGILVNCGVLGEGSFAEYSIR